MMLLLGHLAKVQGLKGEFLLNSTTDRPESIQGLDGLLLVPPHVDLSKQGIVLYPDTVANSITNVTVRSFRWHQGRPCLSFDQLSDRTEAEPYKGWTLWALENALPVEDGETYRHDWVGCRVFVDDALVGEVLRLEPSPGGYDMVCMKDLRPGRHGIRHVPYIKAWFILNLPEGRIDIDPPPGLLDVDIL